MKMPSLRMSELVTVAATPVAIVAAAGLVYQSSHAAFSGSTRNSGNDWSTGAVALTDDDAGSARFQVANMTPGQTDTRCIKVTANATVAGTVKGYAVNPVTSPQGLENHIRVTLERGSGGDFASCAGFTLDEVLIPGVPLTNVFAFNSFDKAVGGWDVPAGTSTKTYRITYRFDTTNLSQAQVDQLQGARTGVDLQWELQSS